MYYKLIIFLMISTSSILFIAKHFFSKSFIEDPKWYISLLSITINLSWNFFVLATFNIGYSLFNFLISKVSILLLSDVRITTYTVFFFLAS